jgi:hypothetical protein
VTYPEPIGVAVQGGGTFWVYNRDDSNGPYAGRLYDSTWQDELTVTDEAGEYALYSLATNAQATDGPTIDFAFRAGGAIRYRRRSADGTWSQETELDDSGSGHVCITEGATGLFVSWLDTDNDRVLFRELGSAWGPTSLWADAGSDQLADERNAMNLNCLAIGSTHWASAVVYTTTDSQAPFRLHFAGLPSGG